MSKNGNGLVPSVDRAAQILKLYRHGDEMFGVSELARKLDFNKSTLHGILNTLSHHHLLERDEATKTYRLGPGLADLAQRVAMPNALDVLTLAHRFVVALAQREHETVLLGVFRDVHVYIADREEAPHELKISANSGGRLPFNAGAFGYIFGAAMTREQLGALIKQKGLRAFTSHTPTKLALYRAELARTRARGYAIEREEFMAGVCSVAAPIANARGQVVAVLCVVGVRPRMPEARLEQLAQAVCASAREISECLGATEYPAWNGIG